mgnify:CR=1 FL=1
MQREETIHHLEMRSPGDLRPSRPARVAYDLRRAEIPCPELSRFFYTAVGGDWLWVEREEQLDAVTALSGSGPAYVFYFLEAMQQAGTELGLTPEQARRLAVGTFAGGAQLAADSPEPLATLRERVTSKGGTTHAGLTVMRETGMDQSFIAAMKAAARRARELGEEY